ncbi:MAG: hypothetical protein ABR964_05450 [Tepidisphaeraceae bacterium]|jgi:excinuclease UvrABC nuclease subunit
MREKMAQIPDILPRRIDFDPECDFEAFVRQAPAKWAVYLLADGEDRPVQLLCVKNLRYSLKHRLGGQDEAGPSKRVNYRQIVRRIHWRRVDSSLEADVVYHEIARQVFPQTYQGMIGLRPAWFLHVNPDAEFPRYVKTAKPGEEPGVYLGPLDDKHAAASLIELVEDAFDLCRYYNILTEAPGGRACAYKEMGKCPAPCDGSISMDQYRRMIDWSVATLADPADMVRQQARRMEQAAAELRFEIAAKIKAYVDQLGQLGKGAYRHVRRLEDFAYVSLQAGPRMGTAKVFLILPGCVLEVAAFIAQPSHPGEILRVILSAAEERAGGSCDAERIGIVTHHLFSPKQTGGVFLPLADISEPALLKAYTDVSRRKQPEEVQGEGVIKELQAM